MDEVEIQKCVICEKSFSGFGNNPEPVEYGGRCCDDCNAGVVIPGESWITTGTDDRVVNLINYCDLVLLPVRQVMKNVT